MLGLYLRLSIEDEESNSIDNQLREGKEFAKKEPFEIYNEGQGVSGRNEIKDRPELDRLLKDISTGKITAVWMRNQNRLERNSMTFHVFASLVKKQGTKVVFGDKVMDWNDPSNFLQSSILTAINSYQAELQSYQTKKSLRDNARDGKSFGITPYGYQTDDKGYFEIKEDESAIVKKIYSLSLSGMGTRSIAQQLNDENIPTRYNTIKEGTITVKNKYTGKMSTRDKSDVKWAGGTVRGIIVNTIYKGSRNWNDETFALPQLQIVDQHYWQKVQDNLKRNSNNTGKSVEHKYLLKGLLECFECGRNYYGRTRVNKKDNYYMCSSKRYKNRSCNNRSINIDVLESFIWQSLFESDTLYQKMVRTFNDGGTDQRKKELSKLIASHQKQLDNLENERKRMVQAVVKGVLKDNEVNDERKRITRAENDFSERLKKDEGELYELKNETRILEDIETDWGYLKWVDEEMREHLKRIKKKRIRDKAFNPSFNEKQRILTKYIQRITIEFDADVKIYIINVSYNLPIPDESYLMDFNYLEAFNVNLRQFVLWNKQLSRSFRPEKYFETQDQLINYFPVTV